MGLKMCKVTVGSREKAYPDGTPFGEIVKDFDQDCKYPVVLVTVDGKLRELHKKDSPGLPDLTGDGGGQYRS